MLNSLMLFTFFCFWLETPFLSKFGPNCQYLQFFLFPFRNVLFGENLVQNVKIVILRLNLLASLIRICGIQRRYSPFWFQNSMMLFTFLFLPENTFLGKFVPKSQNYQFKLKFGTQTNSKMQNSTAVFTFSVFDQKCPFLPNLVLIVKMINLSWNLVPTLIKIPAQISMVIFTFLFSHQKCPFLGKFGPKCQSCQFKVKFAS